MIRLVQTASEIALVAQLAHRIWNQHYVPIIGQAQVDYMVDKFQSEAAITAQVDNGYLYYSIHFKDLPAGYLALVPDLTAKKLMISKIYIAQEFRGKHLGQQLINFSVSKAIELQASTLWLTVNKDNLKSIEWYQAQGFKIKEKVEFDIGNGFIMDDYLMEKKL
ncbi:GNAT family N-acetyltransferase [Mangrovimonas futianensis]|uniref:GNAT family N-acetyltransferase n=1 Tax=Mangrovimonas futianensis TaxID=2895523 RepID=UPI001E5651AF|nr:GNAT family N-acetyltransferase [Mangrovimonas futianensis]MCF1421453.1 GNAT family N-acetyltransferase [Mangrovimonas futianensis]